jgi:hypothetical protein
MRREMMARAEDIRRAADRVAVRTVDYLDSPQGRKVRRGVAAAMLVSAPLAFRVPGLRKYPVVRLIELLGGAAAVMELARMIRDWEPERAADLEAAVAAIVPFGSGNGSGSSAGR